MLLSVVGVYADFPLDGLNEFYDLSASSGNGYMGTAFSTGTCAVVGGSVICNPSQSMALTLPNTSLNNTYMLGFAVRSVANATPGPDFIVIQNEGAGAWSSRQLLRVDTPLSPVAYFGTGDGTTQVTFNGTMQNGTWEYFLFEVVPGSVPVACGFPPCTLGHLYAEFSNGTIVAYSANDTPFGTSTTTNQFLFSAGVNTYEFDNVAVWDHALSSVEKAELYAVGGNIFAIGAAGPVDVTGFDGATTNFSAVNASSVNYPVLEKEGVFTIEWNGINLYFGGANFTQNVVYGASFVSVDSVALPVGVNTSANITFYDVNMSAPVLFVDGVECGDCARISYVGGDAKFSVMHFTNYSVGEGAANGSLSLLSPANESMVSTYDSMVSISYDESLNITAQLIQESGINRSWSCNIYVNGSVYAQRNVTANSTITVVVAPIYAYEGQTVAWNVSCTNGYYNETVWSEQFVFTVIVPPVEISVVDGDGPYWNMTDRAIDVTWNDNYAWSYQERSMNISNTIYRVLFHEDAEGKVFERAFDAQWFTWRVGASYWFDRYDAALSVSSDVAHMGNSSLKVTSGNYPFSFNTSLYEPYYDNRTFVAWFYDNGSVYGSGTDVAFVGFGEAYSPDLSLQNIGASLMGGIRYNDSSYFACIGNRTDYCWYDPGTMGNNATYFGTRSVGWHKLEFVVGTRVSDAAMVRVYLDDVLVTSISNRIVSHPANFFPAVVLGASGSAELYVDDMVMYAGRAPLVDDVTNGSHSITVSTAAVSNVSSSSFIVSKLNVHDVVPQNGTFQYALVNTSWLASEGAGGIQYTVLLQNDSTNVTLVSNSTSLSYILNLTSNLNNASLWVTANDGLFSQTFHGMPFSVDLTAMFVALSCGDTIPNELDLPSQAYVPVNVTVMAPAGFGGSVGSIKLSKGLFSVNSTNCSVILTNATYGKFTCFVPMHFYYGADTYDLNVSLTTSPGFGVDVSSTNECTYDALLASQRTTAGVSFPSASPGVENVSGDGPVRMRNTGNVPFNLYLTGYDLAGRPDTSKTLAASRFRAGNTLGSSVVLANGVQKNVSIAVVPGANVVGNVSLWLSMPAVQKVQEYYASTSWILAGMSS